MLAGRTLLKRRMSQTSWEKVQKIKKVKKKKKNTNERGNGCMPVHLHWSSASLSALPVTSHSLQDLLATSAVYMNQANKRWSRSYSDFTTTQCSLCYSPGLELGVFD